MISVIIPSYNAEKTIGPCIDALDRQSYRASYEIIVVDSSTDKTHHILASQYPHIKVIHLSKRTDPATARNIGITKASGTIVAFTDADCIASETWLEKIAAAHHLPYNVIGGSVLNGNSPENLTAWAGYLAEFREFIPEYPQKEVVHIPTCNISYKKNIFDTYGLFQAHYYPQEDLLFNHMLSSHGEKILFDPTITVYHHHRTQFKNYLEHQKSIGYITPMVLKETQLSGSFIPRHPLCAAIVIPFLPIVKFIKTLFIFLRHQPKVIFSRPLLVPLLFLGLVSWGFGFAQGVYFPHQNNHYAPGL